MLQEHITYAILFRLFKTSLFIFYHFTLQGGDKAIHPFPMIGEGQYSFPNIIFPPVLNFAAQVVLNGSINAIPTTTKIFRDFLKCWDWMIMFV